MNNRREDALIQLAFGELSEAEAQALRASMSESERKEAELMTALRQDLKAMPVAPHQLSTERLRDAILNEGLHPKPHAAPWWRFAWAPVAVLAVAYLGTRFVGGPATTAEPMVAINEATTMSAPAPELGYQPTRDPIRVPDQPATTASATAQGLRGGASDSRTKRPSARRESPRLLAMATPETPSAPAAELATAVIVNAAPANAGASDEANALRDPREEPRPGIVLIDSERDSATGANRAIEVSSASNVVIGG